MKLGKVLVRHPVNIGRWNGRNLLNLPYFDLIAAICKTIPNIAEKHYISEHQGSEKWIITVPNDPRIRQ